jgi:protein gp37
VAASRDKVELFLDESKLHEVLRRRKPTRYFWCDMTDMFWEEYPDLWIDRCFDVMAQTPQHVHMVLTKRAGRMADYLARHFPEPLPNVWAGVSVENQEYADERLPDFRRVRAAVRFVSYEPALGPVNWSGWEGFVDWLIIGGESGSKARPFDSGWARQALDWCRTHGVAPFIKQMGSNSDIKTTDWKGEDPAEWPEDLRVREFPDRPK